jgi:L-2-hydroxyglutarate oxidase LhgO
MRKKITGMGGKILLGHSVSEISQSDKGSWILTTNDKETIVSLILFYHQLQSRNYYHH